MSEKAQKIYCIIAAICLVLLMGGSIAASAFGPLFVFDAEAQPFPPTFTAGEFTAGLEYNTVELSTPTVVALFVNLGDLIGITTVQNASSESDLKYVADHYTEEDFLRWHERVKDENFARAAVLWEQIRLSFTAPFEKTADGYEPSIMNACLRLVGAFLILVFALMAAVSAVIFAIIVFVKLIVFLVHCGHADATDLKKVFCGGISIFPIVMLMAVPFLAATVGETLQIGGGLLLSSVLAILCYVVLAVNRIVLCDGDRVPAIVKGSISAVSLVFALLLLLSLYRLPLGSAFLNRYAPDLYDLNSNERLEEYYGESLKQYSERYADELLSGEISLERLHEYAANATRERLNEEVLRAEKKNIALPLALSFLVTFLAFIGYTYVQERLGFRPIRNRQTGAQKQVGSLFVLAVFVLVGAIFLSMQTVRTLPEYEDSLRDGGYKMLCDPYRIEETDEGGAYALYTALAEGSEESLAKARTELAEASDPETRTALEDEIEEIEQSISIIENRLGMLESSHASAKVTVIVFAALWLAAEIAYFVIGKIGRFRED